MFVRSDAFIVLPGGVGTLDELFTVMSWNILKYHRKPLSILNYDGFYDRLLALLNQQCEEGFIPVYWMNDLIVDSDIDALVDRLATAVETLRKLKD